MIGGVTNGGSNGNNNGKPGGLAGIATQAHYQNRDFQQAQYLKAQGCRPTPNQPGQPAQTLTESYAHGCPNTKDGIELSQAALEVARQQREAYAEEHGGSFAPTQPFEVPDADKSKGHAHKGNGHHGKPSNEISKSDRQSSQAILARIQRDTAFIRSGEWLK